MAATPNGMFIPEDVSIARPLLIALHGGGRDGASQIELWKPLAEREQLFVLAPDSLKPPYIEATWFTPMDGDNLVDRITDALNNHPVNRKRVYVFGHSVGATKALDFGFHNRNAIAATALHSPMQAQGIYDMKAEPGSRRLPMGIWVGEMSFDSNWHCASALQSAYKDQPNLEINLKVIPKHHHNDIYTRPGLTDEIWSFLKQYSL
jgi:predicted esterase